MSLLEKVFRAQMLAGEAAAIKDLEEQGLVPKAKSPIPEGFELFAIKGFYPLMAALQRAEEKGYLPDDIQKVWDAMEFAEVKHTPGG